MPLSIFVEMRQVAKAYSGCVHLNRGRLSASPGAALTCADPANDLRKSLASGPARSIVPVAIVAVLAAVKVVAALVTAIPAVPARQPLDLADPSAV